MMQRIAKQLSAASVLVIFAAACSACGTGGPAISSVNPASPNYSSLQFAVGTANLYGEATGLNVVSTFRQNSGASATGVNTPTLTGPFTLAAAPAPGGGADPYSTLLNDGPSFTETSASGTIEGTPQTVQPGTPNCDGIGALPSGLTPCQGGIPPNTTTFGQSGGVFAMGIAPFNHVAATGQSYSYQPYAVPLFSTRHATFIPWGGPPAFDPDQTGMGERDGVGSINDHDSFGNPFFLGVGEGIVIFDNVTASTGTYSLNVAIATVGNGGGISTSNVTKTATLSSLAVLPTIAAPVVTPDASGDGGATFTMSLPPGVREAYVQIVDYGPGGGPANGGATNVTNCQGARGTAFAPVYYTLHLTNAASTLYTLPPSIGPNLATSGGISNLQPGPSLCTAAQNTAANGTPTPADDIVVQVIGFDYPIYQAALGLTQPSTPENPQIANASGQANLTLSIPEEQDALGTTQVPLHFRRHR